MSADLSRVRFDPRRDFSQVILQQGRLLLDGDFNELVAILDRRLRAETVDLTSSGPDPDHAGSSWVPRQTPDGFKVSVVAGQLVIGRGRMYVDGLLAENHGTVPSAFDALLAESTGSGDTPYTAQPHWPTPTPVPATGTCLAYLDVWAREVTPIEDPQLLEPAVGVDTTARMQTVWQVRLLELPTGGGGVTCSTADGDIPGWAERIAPSSGRLSVDTIPVDDDENPCALPPTGGYRGLENQTYRIEVHDGSGPGTATFKWSRENASVVQPVVEMIDATTLRLASVGRDDVLRISTNDWVEIIDDRAELDGRPGEIRKVTVDDAARTITFSPALPAALQPVDADDAAARHLRVRRWDQKGTVSSAAGATLVDLDVAGSSGLIDVPATDTTQVVLEHGVVVSFSVAEAGGEFHTGDHWIVAARTADTSIDTLVEAPPLGIHHHFARLGVVTLPGASTDCRTMWPPAPGGGESCDCTVCVDPESHASGGLTIQAAISSVADSGGTVCLHAGLYEVGDGIDIEGARSVRLHGQGLATVLVARGDAVRVNRSSGLTIDHLAVVSGAAADSAISVRSSTLCTLEDLVVLALGEGDRRGAAIRLSGAVLGLGVRRNVLVGSHGIASGAPNPDKVDGPGILGGDLRIEDNLLVGDGGIDLGGLSAYAASIDVSRNDVLAARLGGIRASGAMLPGGSLRVGANTLWVDGPGITVGADASVEGNSVAARRAGADAVVAEGLGDGIVVARGFPGRPGHVRVTGNRVSGRGGAGIVLLTAVQTWTVDHNVVERCGAGVSVDRGGRAESVSIEGNQVIDIVASRGETSVAGIAVANVDDAVLSGNSVRRVGLDLVEGRLRAGITVAAVPRLTVTGNVIDGIGPPEYIGTAAGVFVIAPFEQATVSGNHIRYGPKDEPPAATWFAVLIQPPLRQQASFGFLKAVLDLDGTYVLFDKFSAFVVPDRNQNVTLSGNATRSGGRGDGLHVLVRGDVVAEGNQMEHIGLGEPVALRVQGRTATVATNRARGREAMIVLEVDERSFAAVGNITTGGTHLGGAGNGLPAPWDALNPMVP